MQSWSLAAYGEASASVSISADNAKSYVVGVRAGNDHGWSGWVNSASAGPYTPPNQPDPPGSVASVSATRADGTLTASWDAPAGATRYHVTYTSDYGQTWTSAADAHTSTSITISVNNASAYTVGVRAGNDGGWSGWTNSPLAHSYFPVERGIIIQDAGGNAITALAVPEGGEASYQVLLAAPPSETTKVCVYISVRDKNDPDITFKGEAADVVSIDVIFTPQNWNVAQTVTLVAAEDADYANGARDSGLDARTYYAGKVDLAVTEIDNDLPAPANFTVTNGDGFFELAWSAVSNATGYDVRAKINNSASWSSVATGVTDTSYKYTTSAVVNKLAVRATNANAASDWSELTRGPADDWLTTVQQSGASAQSLVMAAAQDQSQLAAPASITVTRDNYTLDEKLYVGWSVVSGASGYNLACAASPSTQPMTSWSWWHCGSVASDSTTTFTVDKDKRGGLDQDLSIWRSYTVAVRAVTSDPAQASPWVLSTDAHPATPPGLVTEDISALRTAGSVSVTWTWPKYGQGYEVECATWENNASSAYTLCADVETADVVNGKVTATISSWTAGGTNYTIDDAKTYDLRVRTTNAWGNSTWALAPLIHPNPALTVSNIGVTAATLTVGGHSGNWYYQADTSPDNTCQGPVSGSSKNLTGLSPHTSYTYSAYSDSGCTTANLLATATQFTTLFASVSNLSSTKSTQFESYIHTDMNQAVAFTTGSNTGGYVLKSVTVPLKNTGGTNGMVFELRAMQGTGQYSSTSQPSDTVLATLSTATPTASTYTDTTVTCSGSGCSLAPNTTYFVTARTGDVHRAYSWALSTSETEAAQPSGNGWSVGFGHYHSHGASDWGSYSDWNIAEITFETVTTLTPSNLTATGATLTIAGHPGDWYYKYTSPSGGTCSNAVSGASTTVTMGGGSYTFAAYSDASCSNLLATTVAFSKDATPAAPSSVTAISTANKELSTSWQQPLWATKYHVTYTCNDGGDWGLVANGAVASEGNLTQTGQTVTATADLSAGWWNGQSPGCRMGVRAGNDNGWSSWVESNTVGPQ